MESSQTKSIKFEYEKEKSRLDLLIASWDGSDGERDHTNTRRELRRKDVNIEEMRQKDEVQADEVFIPRRIIDQNIENEKPSYVQYLEQASHILLFQSKSSPSKVTDNLADFFAKGCRYPGWNVPFHRAADGVALHGGVFMEIRLDDTKPLGFAVEYVPRERLIIPKNLCKSVQKAERILKVYDYMPHELEEYVRDFGFSEKAVNDLLEKKHKQDAIMRDETIRVYQVYFRTTAGIYVAYFEPTLDHWLKAPVPLNLGLYNLEDLLKFAQGRKMYEASMMQAVSQNNAGLARQVEAPALPSELPVNDFPYVFIPYSLIEDEELLMVKGRAHKDVADQDALSHGWTGMVNRVIKASRVYASKKGDTGEPLQVRELKPNEINPQEIAFWSMDYPDPMVITTMQALQTENKSAAHQIDYAVNNRQDSRKTATEIKSAHSQTAQVSSVKLVPYSNAIRELFAYGWEITRCQVLLGEIPLPDVLTLEDFADEYYLLPAGDTEVVQKAEKLNRMQLMYPFVQPSPAGPSFLLRMLELMFPDEIHRWRELLEAPDLRPVLMQLVQSLALVSQNAQLNPQDKETIGNILLNAQNVLQQSGIQAGAPNMAGGAPSNSPTSQPSSEGVGDIDGQG